MPATLVIAPVGHSYIILKKSLLSQSMTNLSAAFPTLSRKGLPLQPTTYSIIHTTTADSQFGFTLQTRPLSSEGFLSIFKPDPQKKQDKDKELNNKVRRARGIMRGFADCL